MVIDKFGKAVLRKMCYHGHIEKKHTGLDDLRRSFASHDKGNVEKSIKKLVKSNFVLVHPASYGNRYSLNFEKISEIEKII